MVDSCIKIENINLSCAHLVNTASSISPCRRLHGHNYNVSVEISGKLAKDGMIIDVAKVKNLLNEYDHKILIPKSITKKAIVLDLENRSGFENIMIKVNDKNYSFPEEDCIILDIPVITVECLCHYFVSKIATLQDNIIGVKITIHETPNVSASLEI